jgi:ParB family chromosome partitioning protein
MLSGHNRINGAKLVGLTEGPCIVKDDVSDDEALMYVVETNVIQRSFTDLLPSEKSTVISLRHSKMFCQGKRNDIINVPKGAFYKESVLLHLCIMLIMDMFPTIRLS